jgi:hypothetical protein
VRSEDRGIARSCRGCAKLLDGVSIELTPLKPRCPWDSRFCKFAVSFGEGWMLCRMVTVRGITFCGVFGVSGLGGGS